MWHEHVKTWEYGHGEGLRCPACDSNWLIVEPYGYRGIVRNTIHQLRCRCVNCGKTVGLKVNPVSIIAYEGPRYDHDREPLMLVEF